MLLFIVHVCMILLSLEKAVSLNDFFQYLIIIRTNQENSGIEEEEKIL